MENFEKTLDKKEAAQRLGISEATLNRLLARGEISHVQIGRRVLFTSKNLSELVERKTRQSRAVAA